MNLKQLEKLAKQRYGAKAVVTHNPKAPDAEGHARIREASKERRERIKALKEMIAADVRTHGSEVKVLAVAARFAVDVDGDEPSWTQLREAVERYEQLAALREEFRALEEEGRKNHGEFDYRYKVKTNETWCWSVKHQAHTAEELAAMMQREAATA